MGVVAESLTKRFGDFTAVDHIDFVVARGTVVGLLGPNGAGKTTSIRMFTTLLRPDGGRAWVAGYDVETQAHEVRSSISLTGQYTAVDDDLTGLENLRLIGALSRLPIRRAHSRAEELLDRFGLGGAASRLVRTYSGGMRRRLDLAASLVVPPVVLFLDEPTTGLDPPSRLELWDVVRDLRAEGTTILLTTQYLEEADQLADRISVIDSGRIIAEGTADELKGLVGGDVLVVSLAEQGAARRAAKALTRALDRPGLVARAEPELGQVTLALGSLALSPFAAGRMIEEEGIRVADAGIRRPSLDDVFLALTGHGAGRGDDRDDGGPTGDRP
ncbi:MAG TPA: ATP-binding cassette domain-containing protein [Acidimicrobiales bacterium]|nr:ATP-binding cassette domain-containing protein [Acidimicrobiales bacterium]